MTKPELRRWRKLRDAVTSFIASGRVTQAHTDTKHIYIDNLLAKTYDVSASGITAIFNTEGYVQQNAKSIIREIRSCYKDFNDNNIDKWLCDIFNVSTDKLDARELGNEVHRLLDIWNNKIIKYIEEHDEEPHLSPQDILRFANEESSFGEVDIRVKCALAAYENFRKTTGLIPLATELPMVSSSFGTGGTIDLLCILDGKITLVDYKTGELKAEHWMQQVLYSEMIKECLGMKVVQIYLWKPSLKDMHYIIQEVSDIQRVLGTIKKCIAARSALQELKQLQSYA